MHRPIRQDALSLVAYDLQQSCNSVHHVVLISYTFILSVKILSVKSVYNCIFLWMAEAVGFAASIAGLLGLAGQILKGCLFVKEFLGDIKNAPAEVKALFNEIEILSSAITITAELLDNSKALTTSLVTAADYEPALKQCLHAVEELVQQISHYGKKNSGERGLRWLEKMKVASEKKELSFHIARLERAKTQLQMVQQNVSLYVGNTSPISAY